MPQGARGVVISFAASAYVTRAPPVLTGEARAQPVGLDGAPGASYPAAPNMAVIDPRALLPLPRRVVTLDSLGEQPR